MRARSLTAFACATLATTIAFATVGATACSSAYSEAEAPALPEAQAPIESSAPAPAAHDASMPDARDAMTSPSAQLELARDFTMLSGVAADDSVVYFADRAGGTVNAVPIAGGMASTVLSTQGAPVGLALVGSELFWLDGSTIVQRSTSASGLPSTVALPAIGAAIVASSARVLVASGSMPPLGELRLYSGTDFTTAPKVLAGSTPSGIALHGGHAYWTSGSTGAIDDFDDARDTTTTLANEPDCVAIAADDFGVYWTVPGEGTIRMRAAATMMLSTLAPKESGPFALVADASGVYWLTIDGKLRRSTRSEVPIETLAIGLAPVANGPGKQWLALTTSYVIVLTADGKVLRVDK